MHTIAPSFPRSAFGWSLVTGLIVLLSSFFWWSIVDLLTPFLAPMVAFVVAAGFCGVVLRSLWVCLSGWRTLRLWASAPLLCNLLTFLLWWSLPFTALNLQYTWWSNHQRYQEVVVLVQEGAIAPHGESVVVPLPAQYRSLSAGGGDILVSGSGSAAAVFFYTFRGISGHASGFLFVPGVTFPSGIFDEDWEQVIPQEGHWYFIASTR
jgi:hypothetical protein